jgi:hypothetical protein
MLKSLIAGAVAVGLIVAPTAAGAMSTNEMSTHKTHKMHHAQKKMKMAPGTTTGMAPRTTTGTATGGASAKTGY